MYKAMIEHYSPLLTSIKSMLGYKTSNTLGISIVTSITLEGITTFLERDFLGVPLILTAIVCLFIVLDWILGTAASIKLANEAKEDGNKDEHLKRKFKSTKIGHTAFKMLSLYLWLLLAFAINGHVSGIPFLSGIFNIITIIPVLLFGFREYISIGEDLEVLTGTKYYLFTLAEKIFEALQFKFLKKIKDD